MSKKLIAVAAAAALALTGLVAIPSYATSPVALKVGAVANGAATTDATPDTTGASALAADILVKGVPSKNTLKFNEAGTGANSSTITRDSSLLKVTVTTAVNNTTVAASATGAVRIIDGFVRAGGVLRLTDSDTGTALLAKDGLTTFTKSTGVGANTATFYVYTTSTASDTFTVSFPGFSQTYHIKGSAGPAYNVAVVAPSSLASSGEGANVIANLTDVFGNAITGTDATILDAADGVLEATGLGLGAALVGGEYDADDASFWSSADAAAEAFKYSTDLKAFVVAVQTTKATPVALSVLLQAASGTAVSNITGLPTAKTTFFATINSVSLSTQVATLTAQVAALQAIVDRKVTKKRYNTLARKWNRAFPSQAVKLKK
jgi:hypothetical protein